MSLQLYNDQYLEGALAGLQSAVEKWARSLDLWYDCGFQSYAYRVGAEPSSPSVVTVLWSDGDLLRLIDDDPDIYTQFEHLLHGLGFWHERWDSVSLYIYAEDSPLAVAFDDYFHWKWICSLLEPDFADIYEEIYDYFASRPDDLHRLSWREFEMLLARVFQSQGFEAELGPGSGDGGIDVRLLQRDPIGDILTLVQAKKYAPSRKIGLEAVAALHGVADVEKAQRSLFVTTSSYQPAAKAFSGRTSIPMELKTSNDVVEWCRHAKKGIIADKSKLVSVEHVERVLSEIGGQRHPRVLHASGGINIILNDFALILKETKHAALLMHLPRLEVSGDGFGQIGTEVPRLDGHALKMLKADSVWRARRTVEDGRVRYWDGRRLFTPWDGSPQHFNWND